MDCFRMMILVPWSEEAQILATGNRRASGQPVEVCTSQHHVFEYRKRWQYELSVVIARDVES